MAIEEKKIPKNSPTFFENTAFLFGTNAPYIMDLYEAYIKEEPIPEKWKAYFETLPSQDKIYIEAQTHPENSCISKQKNYKKKETTEETHQSILDSIRALMLVRAYRVRGHLKADLDPLNLHKKIQHPELDPQTYGFTNQDYDRPIYMDYVLGRKTATLREIKETLDKAYCRHIGIEFMHVQDPLQKAWIQERIENTVLEDLFSPQIKKNLLKKLLIAEAFEKFLHVKYVGTKRFGIDGAESTIPALEMILQTSVFLGIEEIILGMAHRGRLNVLANVFQKPLELIFAQFEGKENSTSTYGSGDVKYHIGSSAQRQIEEHTIHLSLTANPSHLEAVNSVVLGKTRAKQKIRKDAHHQKVMGILIHGDAAFAGQGLVAETLSLSQLEGYKTGGTFHLIINNQIGFTTSPTQARSSPYCSDVAKMIQAPIFHVNGDHPEAVLFVSKLAATFRQKFQKDIIVDLFCYRRFGHNEADEPSFTQPLMYQAIADHPSVAQLYSKELITCNILTESEVTTMEKEIHERLEKAFDNTDPLIPLTKPDWLQGTWQDVEPPPGLHEESMVHTSTEKEKTGLELAVLQEIGKALTSIPKSFHLHPKIKRLFEQKEKMFKTGEDIDWATAEALGFGSLLVENTFVRLSGQDSCRGTFSQRHAVLIDQETEETYTPLNHIKPEKEQEYIEILDSPLAEASVLGFEYGFSQADPKALIIWEAQFGDFANGAQVIIDQFIAGGEKKWLRFSGLVMLLPHGYEGQGPEHSSGRLERYLQLCAEQNMIVTNCTTPANYFHVLRRQIKRAYRKPLVIMTPKSLLRHKKALSSLKDMGPQTLFQPVLVPNNLKQSKKTLTRLIFCSGKVYYDLLEEQEKTQLQDKVALIRIEELYPFPSQEIDTLFKEFPRADIIWCQEEPQNMGAWSYVQPILEKLRTQEKEKFPSIKYIGRPPAASTATGYLKKHEEEQVALLSEAFLFS